MSVLEGRQNSAVTPGGDDIRRFGPATRWVHRMTAALFGSCLATAAILYLPPLSLMFGRRDLIMNIHLYCGFALPVPALLGWLTLGFRRDATELNRFATPDSAWLRARLPFSQARRQRQETRPPATRPVAAPPVAARPNLLRVGGKFNAGQKLYAAVVAGSILVFLGTGLVMYLGQDLSIPDRYRTGASFVHTLFAYGIFFAVCGHLWMASRDPVARAGMRTGYVPRWWAVSEHPHWSALAPAPADGIADAPSPDAPDDDSAPPQHLRLRPDDPA